MDIAPIALAETEIRAYRSLEARVSYFAAELERAKAALQGYHIGKLCEKGLEGDWSVSDDRTKLHREPVKS